MSERDRTRRAQLQAILGDRGDVLAYVPHADPRHPAPGWYLQLAESFGETMVGTAWILDAASNGRLVIYGGIDTAQAAMTIGRLGHAR